MEESQSAPRPRKFQENREPKSSAFCKNAIDNMLKKASELSPPEYRLLLRHVNILPWNERNESISQSKLIHCRSIKTQKEAQQA